MMDKGQGLKECWADEKLTGGTDGMDESEDESLLSSDIHRVTMQELENLGDDEDSAVTILKQQSLIQKMEVENRALKAQCEGISSEMSSILSESKKKTVKIAKLRNTLQALEQQLEEYRISLDQTSQDLQEKSLIIECLQSPTEAYIAAIEELSTRNKHLEVLLENALMFGGPHVDQPKAEELGQLPHSYVEFSDVEEEGKREQEQNLDGIQEQSPVSRRAQLVASAGSKSAEGGEAYGHLLQLHEVQSGPSCQRWIAACVTNRVTLPLSQLSSPPTPTLHPFMESQPYTTPRPLINTSLSLSHLSILPYLSII